MSTNPPPGGYPPPEYPYQGQPQQGYPQQPGYDVGYGQPGQPGIPPQQGAPMPGYAQPGQPADPAAWGYAPVPPQKKRSVLKIVLICLGAFVLVVGGLITWLVVDQTSKMGKYKLNPPSSFDGAPLTTTNSLGNSLSTANQKIAQDGQTPVTAIYGPDSGMPKYVSYGLYGSLALPSVQLDAAFNSAASGATISQKTDEATGPLGGAMRCAVMTTAGNTTVQIPICAWADNSTMDILMQMPDASGAATTVDLSALAEKTRELRQQMEVKK
ncbi:hypothetical protein ABH931_000884 [Streptacidiphilus sp. MAP12-33]|uniref:hypothetical protein n=1 Tax=Streptacidiphilus sp. MAP12-33 TaxID=3156266 RepID=UPI0035169B62